MADQSGGMSNEELKRAASESVAGGENVRERVRQLTLQALQARKFDYTGFRDVMKSMTEGVSLGAEKRGQDVKHALSEAFTGMDQAMSKAAQASSLALKELTDKSKEFSQTELKQGLERMRQMENDFLDSVRQVSQSATTTVKTEWQDLLTHAQRSGTDTGRVVSQTVRDFSARMATTMTEGALAGMEAARHVGERFAAAASGILAGMAEALKPEEKKK
jgi:hypothetical protein